MGMKDLAQALVIAAMLVAPLQAFAGGAFTQARVVAADPKNFDGTPPRPEGDLVTAGSGTDKRSAEQIAKDEQVRADARDAQSSTKKGGVGNLTTGDDVEGKKKIKTEWLSIPLVQTAFCGALIGLLIGSLFGPIGLIAGPLLGAGLFYGLAVHAANKAKAAGDE